MISVVFFGTHDFAAIILEALATNQDFSVLGVVTQPDKPVGRKQAIQKSAVKIVAEKFNLPLFQPATLKKFTAESGELAQADNFVVCQYGLVIPQAVLDMPKNGSINIHPSMLPSYRGASPLQTALLNGEKNTGITIMLMDAAVDHGPILIQEPVTILPDETYGTLSKRLAPIAANLLIKTLTDWAQKLIEPKEQNHALATFTKIFSRDDGKINWHKTAQEIHNQFRALDPWPGIWTMWNGKRLKLLSVGISTHSAAPGKVSQVNNDLVIGTSHGSITVFKLQLEGGKPTLAAAFLSGHPKIIGTILE